jgi:lipoprotein signal peptidase
MGRPVPPDERDMRSHPIGERAHHSLLGPAVAGSAVAIDQLAKTAAPHVHSAFVAPASNPDYAFGAVGGSALALIAGSVVVLGVFLAVIGRLAGRVGVSAAFPALIAGGMLGNTLDRIRYGAVRDFIVVPGGIVNLADFAVAAGVISVVVALGIRARAPHPTTHPTA